MVKSKPNGVPKVSKKKVSRRFLSKTKNRKCTCHLPLPTTSNASLSPVAAVRPRAEVKPRLGQIVRQRPIASTSQSAHGVRSQTTGTAAPFATMATVAQLRATGQRLIAAANRVQGTRTTTATTSQSHTPGGAGPNNGTEPTHHGNA
jgi:hypothetical protein